jgi:cytochrome P450
MNADHATAGRGYQRHCTSDMGGHEVTRPVVTPAGQPAATEPAPTDPYAEYAGFRRECPVPEITDPSGLVTYLVTRYEDARAALTDPRLSKNPRHGEAALARAGAATWRRDGTGFADNMLTTDPPEHTRLRRLVADKFTPRRIESMRPRIQQIVDDLVAGFLPRQRADLVVEYAAILPMTVIGDLLGVPPDERDGFREWTGAAVLPTGTPGKAEGMAALNRCLAGLIEARHSDAGDDLISALITASQDDQLTPAEVLGTAVLLLIAGHETTMNLIANGILALLRHPDQLRLVRREPERLPGAIEEFLRYEAPVDQATTRFATTDLTIGSAAIPAGSVVRVSLGSANRDETEFAGADCLDVTRRPSRHVGFGLGSHYCLGAPLARLEAQLAIGTILQRCEGLTLGVPFGELRWRGAPFVRSLVALPVTFTQLS